MNHSVVLDRGRYECLEVLGISLYAIIYEAHDRITNKRVAIKALSLAGEHRNIVEAMFRKEVDALAGFEHPSVVRMLRRFEEGDLVGIVLELVPGRRTLEQMLLDVKAGKAMTRPLRWRLDQLRCVLEALDAAHRRSVIHRDVKPANILFDRDAEALKLSDFGIARILEHYGKGAPGATLHQFYTRPYAAPEQALRGEATFASDVYAFALVAAACLSGTLPTEQFRTEELPALLEPLRAEVKNSVLYQELVNILQGALNDEPAARPRLAAIQQVLVDLLERATEQPKAEIQIPARALEKADRHGVKTVELLLNDLNDGLRARYEETTDQQTGKTSFTM